MVFVKVADSKIFKFLVSNPVSPSESEGKLFMRIYCGGKMGIWMLAKGCFERQ